MQRSHAGLGLARAGLLALVLLVWQLLWLRGLPEYVLGPFEILQHFFAALGEQELYGHIGASLTRSLPGFAIGTLLGIALGLAAGVSRAFDRMLSPAVFLTYPVPKIVMLPLFMLWFGIGDVSKILIIALACFYPTFINADRAVLRYFPVSGQNNVLEWKAPVNASLH